MESIFGMGGFNMIYNCVSKLKWKFYRNYMYINMYVIVLFYWFFLLKYLVVLYKSSVNLRKVLKL